MNESFVRFHFPVLLNQTFLLPVLLLFVVWTLGCSNPQSTWERIEESGTLRIGMDPTFPPFEVSDGQNLWGLDVDLSQTIAEELRLTPEYTYFGYDGLYDALATNKVDLLISALVIFPERTRDFSYSESYFDAGQVLVTNRGVPNLSVTDLEGQTVAVELGSQGHVEITRLERQLKALKVLTFASSELALSAVVDGTADVAVADHVSARLYRRTEPALVISDQFLTNEPYSLVVRSEDKELLQRIDRSLIGLASSGRLENIISNWLDMP